MTQGWTWWGSLLFGLLAASAAYFSYGQFTELEAVGGSKHVHIIVWFLYNVGGKWGVVGFFIFCSMVSVVSSVPLLLRGRWLMRKPSEVRRQIAKEVQHEEAHVRRVLSFILGIVFTLLGGFFAVIDPTMRMTGLVVVIIGLAVTAAMGNILWGKKR